MSAFVSFRARLTADCSFTVQKRGGVSRVAAILRAKELGSQWKMTTDHLGIIDGLCQRPPLESEVVIARGINAHLGMIWFLAWLTMTTGSS